MKKCALILPILLLTGCSVTEETFSEAAQSRNFSVERLTYSEGIVATKGACSCEFHTLNDDEAGVMYIDLSQAGEELKSQAASKSISEHSFLIFYNHLMVKTASRYFYITQIGNTIFYANTSRNCEEKLEEILSIIKY